MTSGLTSRQWTAAFTIAVAVHAAVWLYSVRLPGGAPVYRGGGTFEQGDATSSNAAGVLVRLGNAGESTGEQPGPAQLAEEAPAQASRESLAQAAAPGTETPGAAVPDAPPTEVATPEAPVPAPEPQTASVPAPDPAPNVRETPPPTAAAPVPKRKPAPPDFMPELETLGRRLSVQSPEERATATAPARPAPGDSGAGGSGADAGEGKGPSRLSMISGEQSLGTAGSSRTGEVRELNYEDKVLLWLKRHGAYPYEAAMYRLEDTVTLKFAINRRGDILYYKLTKKSKYHLLNRAVERMMQRSSPVPPIPPEIGKDELTFTVPVHFFPAPPPQAQSRRPGLTGRDQP